MRRPFLALSCLLAALFGSMAAVDAANQAAADALPRNAEMLPICFWSQEPSDLLEPLHLTAINIAINSQAVSSTETPVMQVSTWEVTTTAADSNTNPSTHADDGAAIGAAIGDSYGDGSHDQYSMDDGHGTRTEERSTRTSEPSYCDYLQQSGYALLAEGGYDENEQYWGCYASPSAAENDLAAGEPIYTGCEAYTVKQDLATAGDDPYARHQFDTAVTSNEDSPSDISSEPAVFPTDTTYPHYDYAYEHDYSNEFSNDYGDGYSVTETPVTADVLAADRVPAYDEEQASRFADEGNDYGYEVDYDYVYNYPEPATDESDTSNDPALEANEGDLATQSSDESSADYDDSHVYSSDYDYGQSDDGDYRNSDTDYNEYDSGYSESNYGDYDSSYGVADYGDSDYINSDYSYGDTDQYENQGVESADPFQYGWIEEANNPSGQHTAGDVAQSANRENASLAVTSVANMGRAAIVSAAKTLDVAGNMLKLVSDQLSQFAQEDRIAAGTHNRR